ncbi:hypothetical protein HRI_003098800 [Hibiscus trionum]|uniref:BZIP domain-containing protein n=1 Tax=Hibiscus trionum TaxID=183268 RepID=A0A9W7MDJ3_HIBTR|nr:hypothetical protein HRI_003098800 [Hibiscus trionum]
MAGIKIRDVNEETPNVSLSHCEGQRVGSEMGMDPKKLKRVAASREYSQRYRLKQQQYIAHLESGVRALQAQVAITYPKIKYVDTQNSLLRAENCSMKEKLSALSAELMMKEAEYHELRKEKEVLKQFSLLYQSPIAEMSQAKQHCFAQLVNITRDQPGFNMFAGEAREPAMPDRNLENQFGCQQQRKS